MLSVPNELLIRARQDYLEMPGLVLTTEQAGRLWNLDRPMCQELLAALVREQFLAKTRGGAFLHRGAV